MLREIGCVQTEILLYPCVEVLFKNIRIVKYICLANLIKLSINLKIQKFIRMHLPNWEFNSNWFSNFSFNNPLI